MVWFTTDEAEDDLQFIAEHGVVQFGPRVSRSYALRLLGMFDTLASNPQIGSERHAANRLIRLMPCGAHNIIYVVENEDVIILRVLHGLQDWFDLI